MLLPLPQSAGVAVRGQHQNILAGLAALCARMYERVAPRLLEPMVFHHQQDSVLSMASPKGRRGERRQSEHWVWRRYSRDIWWCRHCLWERTPRRLRFPANCDRKESLGGRYDRIPLSEFCHATGSLPGPCCRDIKRKGKSSWHDCLPQLVSVLHMPASSAPASLDTAEVSRWMGPPDVPARRQGFGALATRSERSATAALPLGRRIAAAANSDCERSQRPYRSVKKHSSHSVCS